MILKNLLRKYYVNKSKIKKKKTYDKPISLRPLKVDEALGLFLKVDPKKLKEDERDNQN